MGRTAMSKGKSEVRDEAWSVSATVRGTVVLGCQAAAGVGIVTSGYLALARCQALFTPSPCFISFICLSSYASGSLMLLIRAPDKERGDKLAAGRAWFE